MAAVVVFCTTYALILPAITKEKNPTCGLEAHQHEASCHQAPEQILSCSPEIHSHGPECVDEQGYVICGENQYLIHSHEDHCYDRTGALICALPAVEAHQHTQNCYAVPETVPPTEPAVIPETQPPHVHGSECYTTSTPPLICGLEEHPGHIHSESEGCYTCESILICTVEESEGHQHGADCVDPEGNLVCTLEEQPGHRHDDTCMEHTATLTCPLEETSGHQHEDSCYGEAEQVLTCEIPVEIPVPETQPPAETEPSAPAEPVLICGYGDPVIHQHEDGCFLPAEGTPELICGKEEHIHDDLRCYADPTADLEREQDWVQTLPTLSGTWRQDIVAIAQSQLGYTESTRNYIVEEDDTVRGYTRYGQWYGDLYGDWCAMFASFCLHYAGIPQETIPWESGCQRWIDLLEPADLYRPASDPAGEESYLPEAGDLVFYDKDGSGISDHVGVVESVQDGMLHTIEGNLSNAVRREKYELTDPVIMGYGIIPQQPVETPPEVESQPEEDPTIPGETTIPEEESQPTEPEMFLTEQTIRAVIYTDASLQQRAVDETEILITGLLPQMAKAVAYPVELEADLIEGETVLFAYDISILDGDGNPFVQADHQNPFLVSIQPPGWNPSEDENYNIYYVPEEGDPELVASESEEDAVSFSTDHFSTYVLTATGSQNTIYLNGQSGSDSNTGTSANSAVKTLERALSVVKDGGTIYISGTVPVTGTVEWDLDNSVTLKRYSSFTGPLVTVSGNLTLKNITINGGSATPSSSNIATNTTFASGSAKAPMIVVESGGSLNIRDGAMLEYNSNKPDISSSNFKENGYVGLGGAIYCQGNLTMSGGTIRYCEAQAGGGIYIESASTNRITFNLSGGAITYNYARDIVPVPSSGHKSYHKNAGGGVYLGDYVTMNMSGGTISNNQTSREGGGVSMGWLNRNKSSAINQFITTFNMSGGTFTGNLATSTGGGLNVTAGREAYITAGYFTGNTANGKEYQPGDSSSYWTVYSGGGIYLDSKQFDSRGNYAGLPGYAQIHRVLIANNTAGYYGGGIATCSTSVGTVNASVDMDGTLIYGNTAKNGGNEMYLEGDTDLVGNKMLGGATYSWTKSGSYYDNSLTESSAGVVAGKPIATVIITGNTAGVDGGGIGCNGEIEIGGNPDTESISVTKVWNDDGTVPHPGSISFQVYLDGKPYGEPITIASTTGTDGTEIWPTVYVDNLPSGSDCTIAEIAVPGFDSSVSSSGSAFTITNTPCGFSVIKKWVGDSENDRPDSITVQLYQDGKAYGDPVKLTAAGGWKYLWINLPEGHTYTAKELDIPEGYYSTDDGQLIGSDIWQITNTRIPDTSVSVEKRWADGIPGADRVTIELLSNGVKISEAPVSSQNGWYHKWDNLPKFSQRGEEIRYTVRETALKGYSSAVTQGTSPSQTTSKWESVTPKSGGTYLIVSNQGALSVSGSSMAWTDVSGILASGGDASSSSLWTWNNTLKNGNGKFLYISRSSGSYRFSISSNSSTISISNGHISSSNRYLTSLSSGYGNTSTSSGSAITFTFYQKTTSTVTGGDVHYVVTNTKLPDALSFRFGKYAVGASDTPTLLAGADLALYQASDSGTTTIPGTTVKGTLIDSWTSENASGVNGGIHVKELYSGTYYLIETRTPAGHAGLSGPVVFEVSAESGTVQLIQCPYELTLSGDPEVEFPIYNTVSYVLPETGGMGTDLFTAVGLMLIISSVSLLLSSHRRRRRGCNSSL